MKAFLQGTSLIILALLTPAVQAQQPAASVDDLVLEEIIVTAQRRSETLQTTALAISAVDANALINAGVSQPQDLTKLVPALQLSPLGAGGTQVTIRGVGNFAPFLYSEPAVAINYDGVYLARSAAPNGLFFDVERVEVLKGPQGTLYGRNATGGAVNIITAKPEIGTVAAEGTLELGNYDLKRGSLMVNAPLGENAALRIAGQAVDRDGYLSDGYLDDKGQALRAQILLEPSDRLLINLEADYIHQGGKGPAGVFVPPTGYLTDDPYAGPTSPASLAVLRGASLGISGGTNPNFLPPFATDGYTDLDIWGASATIDYDLGFGGLTFQPAYRSTKNNFKHYAGGFPLISHEESEQTTVELRLASPGDSDIKWVIGAYYFDDSSNLFADANQGVSRTATTASALPVESVAAFGQATFPVTDTLRLTGGARYTTEEKKQTGVNVSRLPPVPATFPGPAAVFYGIACPSPATPNIPANTCTGPFSGKVSFERATWKVGIEYDLAEQSLLYANAESGFKAGGFYPSLAPNTYDPEKIFAVTLGSKNRFADNRVQLNLEGFYWQYKDKQVSHLGPIRPAGYTIITENAGEATIYGAEADLLWRPSAFGWLTLNLQYVKSEYDEFRYIVPLLSATAVRASVNCPQTITTSPTGSRTSTVDCTGKTLPQTPEFTLNASYRHRFPVSDTGDLDAIIGTRVQSSFYTGEEFLPGQRQGGSMVSYASLTYRAQDDRYSIGVYVDNIEDKVLKASSFVQPAIGVPVIVPRPPRTYGLRTSFKF